MPISPLSEDSVRQLGSSLVITSPVLLLKELLDNAIDSGATCIDILVSPNTVDKLEMRDNGHGINPDDLDSLGRPGHTSKLRSLDELDTLGGNTLGFRGIALASANSLADVSVTSRVSSEPVATAVSLAKGGGIGTQRHAGAPVGTTVCVTRLFSSLPVRLRVAIKEAPKNLAKIKQLLQSYALARPWIRLRFAVLKTPNLSWSYAPAPGGSVMEAAMQIFSTELASQCIFETFPTGTSQSKAEPTKTLVFEALLPRSGADPQKINQGAFLSIDSRPVSTKRSTAKKLIFIFKTKIGNYLSRSHSGDVPKEPFIRLNIRCPPGTYDVNIEPSKDDVLFKEEQHVLDQFESFLSLVYPAPERHGSHHLSMPVAVADREALCATPRAMHTDAPGRPLASQDPASSWKVDMSSGLEDLNDGDGSSELCAQQNMQQGADKALLPGSEDDIIEGSKGKSPKEGLNPWSIAKLTSSNRRGDPLAKEGRQEVRQQAPLRLPEHGSAIETEWASSPATQASHTRERLESQPNRDTVDIPASQGKSLRDVLGHGHHRAAASSPWPSNRHNRSRRYHVLQSPPTSSPDGNDYDGIGSRERLGERRRNGSDRLVQSQISFNRNSRRQEHHDRVGLDGDQLPSGPSVRNRRIRISTSARPSYSGEGEFMIAGLVGTKARPGRDILQAPSPPQPLPHNAPDAAEAPPEVHRRDSSDEETHWPNHVIDDARVQLIKQQRPGAENLQKKPRRMKTEQLPLETIPRDSQTCTLLITVTANMGRLAQLLTIASRCDTWLVDGKLRDAFEDGISPEDTAKLVEPLLARISH
ncbi:hypothetical protein C8A03DRAFT_14151 [Achaetomium macrosporum]|uniref:DNA mismatch repair protein S5 domain-containing protein n=1 Tax=Achaetomium macrosporum TaxID=79813 RepID=A0AAN7HEY4_9PEZI|nr:hypothetical protein C8A03DRAFT_14151 [Achaetomium macrosporum]